MDGWMEGAMNEDGNSFINLMTATMMTMIGEWADQL